jgi:hypothetical protein
MTRPAVKPIPEGMHSITPHLVCAALPQRSVLQEGIRCGRDVPPARPRWKVGSRHASHRRLDADAIDEFPEMCARGPKQLLGLAGHDPPVA